MRFRSAVSALVFLAVMAFTGGRAAGEMIDGIVAVVDDTIIMASDLHERMESLGAPAYDLDTQRQVLDLMVEDIVVKKIYESLGLPPVADEEASELSEQSGMSISDARSYIRKAALMDLMVRSRVVVTENMVRSYYESQPQYQGKESVHLNQILMQGSPERLEYALEELDQGAAFEEVAKRYSDVLVSGSPDIGWVAVEDLSPEVRSALEAVQPGDVVGPLDMNGYQALYELLERGTHGGTSFEEVRDEITAELQRKYQVEAFDHWLEKMMSEYFIGIYIQGQGPRQN